ncbi:MAG: mechanosensitive ion channel family protein [Tychonema bourrellyi B0820]|uniref:Small-conductance mechanosensitive channel n=1 Tax=Tychonema bourrellyi FEM_GT703 TaxID=2040638 RepID=A0A2G4F4P0_9CYAN|nr:mechanosensitive ion channel family protein [Tychonema bourrellyi]MDQ2097626.1 mechanosensitive ion channel family protein [Tychonema bourrellyi B0820]PHX56708.1 small-conductance mechanosensitive channel [Tychonema bourrellyi FEM_GT703]
MGNLNWQESGLIWVIVLGIGFPLLVILLGEVIQRLKRQGNPLASTLRTVKNLVLPSFALMIFVRDVFKLDPQATLVKVIQTLFWICVINAALSLINALLFEQAEADTWRGRMPKLLVDLCRVVSIFVGGAIVLSEVWGADLAGLATALGVTSIVLGLALQDPLGSILMGIMLLFERPFNIGDWLKVGDAEGQVIDMNWRAVRLLTEERQVFIIPHQILGKEVICNYTAPDRIYFGSIKVGFSYDNPPNVVRQVLFNTALSVPGILAEPEPDAQTISYDDFVITYKVEFFVKDFLQLESAQNEFMTRIWYAARRNNLTLYHYKYQCAVESNAGQTDSTASKLSQGFSAIPALIPVTREQSSLDQLTKGTILQHFGRGETAIRQGDRVFSMYIIISGEAVMTVLNDAGPELEVVKLSRGEFFGVMALFSREASPVSVTAVEDMEVMVINSDAVNAMIERQPSLSREIAQVIEMRRHAINIALRTSRNELVPT